MELTALSGSTDYERTYYGIDYDELKLDDTEIRISALYTLGAFKYVSFGAEYINIRSERTGAHVDRSKHLVNRGTSSRPDYQWDGTYTEKVTPDNDTYNTQGFFAKTSVAYPLYLYKGNSSSLCIKPRVDLAVGYEVVKGNSAAAYICDGFASLVYEFGRSSVILDGGYRYCGSFEGESGVKGVMARAGYAFRW